MFRSNFKASKLDFDKLTNVVIDMNDSILLFDFKSKKIEKKFRKKTKADANGPTEAATPVLPPTQESCAQLRDYL